MRITSKYFQDQNMMLITLKGAIVGKEVTHLKMRLQELENRRLSKIILNCEAVSHVDPAGEQLLRQWRQDLAQYNISVSLIVNF